MSITPGETSEPRDEPPLLNEEPPPPGEEDLTSVIEAIDDRIREAGPEEVEQADEEMDAD